MVEVVMVVVVFMMRKFLLWIVVVDIRQSLRDYGVAPLVDRSRPMSVVGAEPPCGSGSLCRTVHLQSPVRE